jgi:hypothetical protein
MTGSSMSVASELRFSTLVSWGALTLRLQLVCLVWSLFFISLTRYDICPAGGIIEYGSYKIALHSMGGAFGVMLFLVFFFMPESAFHREALNIDTGDQAVRLYLHLPALDQGGARFLAYFVYDGLVSRAD